MILILGIDPGKTTGLALMRLEEKRLFPVAVRESKDQQALDFRDLIHEADHVICEAFLVRPKNARRGNFDWDDMVAPRVIGAVELLAKLEQKPFVLQQPSIKPVGYGWANQKYTKGKGGMHIQDAIAHAVYFAVRKLGALPVDNGK